MGFVPLATKEAVLGQGKYSYSTALVQNRLTATLREQRALLKTGPERVQPAWPLLPQLVYIFSRKRLTLCHFIDSE
jgi:hypothetical protein